jgi:amino acid permease
VANESEKLTEDDPCWTNIASVSRMNAYRIYVVVFNCTIGILVFYNIQKTKLLQLLTTLMRWIAFVTMITLAVRKIHENASSDPPVKVDTNVFNVKGVPNFFGICIYAFMCHHSLPSIITPMKRKVRTLKNMKMNA